MQIVLLPALALALLLGAQIQNGNITGRVSGPKTGMIVHSVANSLLFGKINPGSDSETAAGTKGYAEGSGTVDTDRE